jgi:transposase-like protein
MRIKTKKRVKGNARPGRPRNLYLDDIRIDGNTQVRCKIDEATVADYADAILAGDRFPPVVVFHDGTTIWLADGFNRYHAHRKAQKATIAAQVKPGTQSDAAWYALGANRVNGTRLTNEDKARAVKRALQLRPGTSNREIAEYVGVSGHLVEKYRDGLQAGGAESRQGKDGKFYPSHLSHGNRKKDSTIDALKRDHDLVQACKDVSRVTNALSVWLKQAIDQV